MSIFDVFRKKKAEFDSRLFGRWRLQRSEQDLPAAEDTIAEFSPDGALTYSITQGGKTGIMKMTYRVEGGFILSDQPSSPREERTEYRIDSDGSLILIYGGQPSRFLRV
jgi:hypothetical protein